MAVKMAPKLPQAPSISGSVCQTALAWIKEGEKQYKLSARNPPVLPHNRRATYQSEAPRNTPQARNGSRGSQRQYGEYSESSSRWGSTSKGAAVTRESNGDCSTSNAACRGVSSGNGPGGST